MPSLFCKASKLIDMFENCEPNLFLIPLLSQVSPVESNIIESVCSLKFAQRVRTVELGPASSSRRHTENSSTSSSPTHDSVEVHTHNFNRIIQIIV